MREAVAPKRAGHAAALVTLRLLKVLCSLLAGREISAHEPQAVTMEPRGCGIPITTMQSHIFAGGCCEIFRTMSVLSDDERAQYGMSDKEPRKSRRSYCHRANTVIIYSQTIRMPPYGVWWLSLRTL
jgi:hypothetical protein